MHGHPGKTSGQIGTDGIQQLVLCLCQPAHLTVGIDAAALNLQKRLDVQNGADGSRRRGNPTALFQIFQGIHRQINAGL